jgi:hypothetical protein
VITPQAWIKETETELSDSGVLTLPGGFEPATPKSLAWPRATRLSGQLPPAVSLCDEEISKCKLGSAIVTIDACKNSEELSDLNIDERNIPDWVFPTQQK